MIQLILISMVVLTKCGEKKLSESNSNGFEFEKAIYKKWASGIPGGGAGFLIELKLKKKNPDIVLEKVLFKNWIADLNTNDSINYYASINDGTNNGSKTTLGESNDQIRVSKRLEDLPMDLKEDESILYYKEGSAQKYLKLKLVYVEGDSTRY